MCWGTDLGLGVCVELMGLHWGVCVCVQAQRSAVCSGTEHDVRGCAGVGLQAG